MAATSQMVPCREVKAPFALLVLLDPFFQSTFQKSPLTCDLECRNLPLVDHAMQSSLGNLEYDRRLAQRQKFDRTISVFREAPPSAAVSERPAAVVRDAAAVKGNR